MNKLVSRNPILRFLLGKKIVKAKLGTPMVEGTKVGDYTRTYYRNSRGERKLGWRGLDGNFIPIGKEIVINGTILKGTGGMTSESLRPLKSKGLFNQVKAGVNNSINKINNLLLSKKKTTSSVTKNPVKKAPVQKLPEAVQLPETTTTTQLTTTTYTPPTLNFNPNNLPIFSAPKTPDFGYRTTNDYTSSDFRDKLNGLGINNNANFVRFLNETGGDTWTLQFRNDARYALGADYSDENIRKVFNTQGNWGRGFLGRGDYGDLLNALAGYAKEWNDAYNRKSQEYDLANKYFKTPTFFLYTPTTIPLFSQSSYLPLISKWWAPALSLTHYMKKGGLISKNPVERFKVVKALKGISFKQAFNNARSKKQRYFNWTDAKGNTRMYNSKSAGNDTEYESFIDNMNEMSALLPTDTLPKHLGWDRNNPTSSELRGKDRQIKKLGTESTLPEIFILGLKKVNPKIFNRIKIGNTIYSRGIALNFPGINTNKTGLFTKGNKIFKRDLVNGKYVETPVGVIHKGLQYYDESIYGRNKFNQFSTSTDNDNVVTYDEYRNRLSGASRNKFMGYEAIKGQNIPSELPLTLDMRGKYNVLWFKNYKF